MKGKVINFNQEKSFGFILGENGQNYFFHTSDVNLPFEVSKNRMLTFNPSSNQKGLCAKNVVLGKDKQLKQNNNSYQPQKRQRQSQPKKKRFVMIGDITVNLNDVKNAQLQGDCDNAKLLIRTYSSGILKITYCYGRGEHGKVYTNNCANDKAREDLNILLNQL